jgi:hypothetical protein
MIVLKFLDSFYLAKNSAMYFANRLREGKEEAEMDCSNISQMG